MPVNVDKNLTIKNNTMDASYGELFKKLNVAYAWTHTKTTSAGGTAIVFKNNDDIITSMECDDINKCSIGTTYDTYDDTSSFIVNGKIYQGADMLQKGSKTDYKYTGHIMNNCMYAIDSSNKLWRLYGNPVTETQIGADTTWEKLSLSDYNAAALNDGKIYATPSHYATTFTQYYTDLTNVSDMKAYSYSTGGAPRGICINNGILYKINGSSYIIMDSKHTWSKIFSGCNYAHGFIENNLGEVFSYNYNSEIIYNTALTNCKKICYTNSSSNMCVALTNDNKIILAYNFSSTPQKIDISNEFAWNDIISIAYWSNPIYKFYAIGDGKIYDIQITGPSYDTRTISYTQIGTATNCQKIDGSASGQILIAWTGDATTVSHTVLTTKSPHTNDTTYIDEDLTKYSTVQSTTNTTITDEYRTYTRDVSKDSSFTAIPPATIHETVSTVDFLRITNPNT